MNGILNIFKPKGISSYQTVRKVKNILNINKAGHTGTLDPSATGVLLICLGKATKISEFIVDLKKTYQGEMILGLSTDSQDSEGKIIRRRKVDADIDEKIIKDIFQKYKGTINQIPPMYSAVHYKGERLYHLARRGIGVKRKPRKVKIFDIKLINFIKKDIPVIKFEVICSKGTYVRTLCSDIGDDLGCGAYLCNLVRKKIGNFSIEDSLNLEKLKKEKNIAKKYLISIDSALKEFYNITVKNDAIKIVLNGGMISIEQIVKTPELLKISENKFVKIHDTEGNLLSISMTIKRSEKNIIFKPIKVFKNY
jgi:tRNA pseudouridine55 synthase